MHILINKLIIVKFNFVFKTSFESFFLPLKHYFCFKGILYILRFLLVSVKKIIQHITGYVWCPYNFDCYEGIQMRGKNSVLKCMLCLGILTSCEQYKSE